MFYLRLTVAYFMRLWAVSMDEARVRIHKVVGMMSGL